MTAVGWQRRRQSVERDVGTPEIGKLADLFKQGVLKIESKLLKDEAYEQQTITSAGRLRRKRIQLLEWAATIEEEEMAKLRSKQATPEEQQAEQGGGARPRSRGASELTTSDPEVRAVLQEVWDRVWPGRTPGGASNPYEGATRLMRQLHAGELQRM